MVKWAVRILVVLTLGFCLFCALYFLKSRLPFEFSEKISLHQYAPFKYLVRKDTFGLGGPEPVMAEDFNRWVYFSRWYHLWAGEAKRVELRPEENGYGGTGGLGVISRSRQGWTVSAPVFIAVAPGTRLVFEAMLYRDFPAQEAGLRLAGFDRTKKRVDNRLAKTEMRGDPGRWEKLTLAYTVPQGIAYVRPRIRGKGTGRVKLDNILVTRY
jgi:hypothetical protein